MDDTENIIGTIAFLILFAIVFNVLGFILNAIEYAIRSSLGLL